MVRRQFPADLIEAAQDGDQAAILSLLTVSQPDIRRYAQRSCRAADVDDAVQEALWLLNTRIGGLRAAGAFASWLFQIVRRECARLTRRKVETAPIEDMQDTLDFSTRPNAELRLDLADAIHSLPVHYRAIVLMRDMEDFTIDDIATSLELTREAVKARLHRARHLLREYMTD
ncbi:RNA polymerase sigma factor [Mesorhizobium sp. Cs1299R1N3]|uniref:RNA polymerase sigma factor n=1 Tax=Mesorhizobium sp. Cs1299R1N3 TaxID=3015173 RepID=UPI00301D22F7